MDRKKWTSLLWVFLGVAVVLYVWAFLHSEHRQRTRFLELAKERPSEANRVVHAAGFSIVRPAGWEADTYDSGEDVPENRISIFACEGRFTDSYQVSRVRTASRDLTNLLLRQLQSGPLADVESIAVLFQQNPAFLRLAVHEGADYEDPTRTYGALYFRRDDAWYQIRFDLRGAFTEIPPGLWQFFETFREEA